jgi:S1-C subfamily serine protease
LGVTWDKTASQESGLLLNHVTAGSSADRAGLRKGDRVVQFAGRPVNDEAHFMADVLAAKSPVEVMVHRGDQRDPLKLAIVLSGGPTRLGIAWREDDAEPGTLTLTRVVPGSPAQRAGLQLRDRVYEIAGRRFASSQEFVKLATTLPSPVELLVERNGRLSTVRFDVPPALPHDVSGIQKTPPEFAPGIKGSDGESHEFTTTADTIEDWWSI